MISTSPNPFYFLNLTKFLCEYVYIQILYMSYSQMYTSLCVYVCLHVSTGFREQGYSSFTGTPMSFTMLISEPHPYLHLRSMNFPCHPTQSTTEIHAVHHPIRPHLDPGAKDAQQVLTFASPIRNALGTLPFYFHRSLINNSCPARLDS